MDSPDMPAPPDPYATAGAQGAANINAARVTTGLNRPNQYTPFGSLTWEQGPMERQFDQAAYDAALASARGSGGLFSGFAASQIDPNNFYRDMPSDKWTSKVTLDPKVQEILDAQLNTSRDLQGSTDKALERVNSVFNSSSPETDAQLRQRAEDALYGRLTSRLNPRFGQEENQLRSGLMNRGIVEGSEAWRTQMENFGRGKNDAYEQAMFDSIARGSGEQQAQQGARMSVLNELNALRTGQQAQMPTFQNGASGANVNPAPIAQSLFNSYQGQMNGYNADVASQNAMIGAGASAAASIIPLIFAASDRRLKKNITRIGTHPLGFGWYSYQYTFGDTAKWHEGAMADEVEKVLPAAVVTHPAGFKMVDYGMLQ